MKRSALIVLFFGLTAHASGQCERSLRAQEARAQILEAQHTAELLGLCLRNSFAQVKGILAELADAASLKTEDAQNLFNRAEEACRLQVRVAPKKAHDLNIRARETLPFEPWYQW